jgi:hypothetical protein
MGPGSISLLQLQYSLALTVHDLTMTNEVLFLCRKANGDWWTFFPWPIRVNGIFLLLCSSVFDIEFANIAVWELFFAFSAMGKFLLCSQLPKTTPHGEWAGHDQSGGTVAPASY